MARTAGLRRDVIYEPSRRL